MQFSRSVGTAGPTHDSLPNRRFVHVLDGVARGVSTTPASIRIVCAPPLLRPWIILSSPPIRVFFPCTGLGRQRRGFETFTAECATALHADPRLDITVFGGGPTPGLASRPLWNLPRDSNGAALLNLVHRNGTYFSEQLTFFMSFLPRLIIGRPDIVYFADLNLGNLCWHWRRLSRQQYRLLFYNGGLTTMPFTRADFVQQLTPLGIDEAAERGEDIARQVLLPHGVDIPDTLPPRLNDSARAPLGLPPGKTIILSVGMLDTTIKRMDYVIREVAALAPPRPFLVLLGAETSETPGLRELAVTMLGRDGFLIHTVQPSEIGTYYRAADVFVLASLREGFGLAYVEALACGLPIVAHDFAVTRYLLDGFANLVNLTKSGAMTRALSVQLGAGATESERVARHESAKTRFSWNVLRDQYSSMLRTVATAPLAEQQ